MNLQQNDSISGIPFVGPGYQQKLSVLGISTIYDLLTYFPYRYEDTSEIVAINQLSTLSKKTVIGTVTDLKNIRLKSFKTIQKATIRDNNDSIEVVWFNMPFLAKNIRIDQEYLFYGKLSVQSSKPQLQSPDYQIFNENTPSIHLGGIIPIYRLTAGITNKWLRSRIHHLISQINTIDDLDDPMPEEIISKYYLIDLVNAIKNVHFPESMEAIDISRKRLAFDELISIQLKLLKEKQKHYESIGPKASIDNSKIEKFLKTLPFKLNSSQKQAIDEILKDYQNTYPMQRLLEGDVGSGKTIVAITAMLPILENNFQIVLLAPTSVLAKQHYETVKKLLGERYSIELITSDTRKRYQNKLKIDILVGTHAILHNKDRLIENLGLVIIDEQHKFGVQQRRELLNLNNTSVIPHFLSLTATPIPRSLAQVLFGDRDLSTLERISKRKTVKTLLTPENKRKDAYKWIKDIIDNGSQVFWICPLIEENPDQEIKSVKLFWEEIQKIFPENSIKFIHGKMKSLEKDTILSDFQKQKFQILLSTTVIEVGIDIPNANLIIIENAERYGLAQLHQLRGRVGRSDNQAWCILFTPKETTPDIVSRLNYLASETDGIKISEFDLQKRGPGEVYGNIQSGLPALKIANFSNISILKQTREAALYLLDNNYDL